MLHVTQIKHTFNQITNDFPNPGWQWVDIYLNKTHSTNQDTSKIIQLKPKKSWLFQVFPRFLPSFSYDLSMICRCASQGGMGRLLLSSVSMACASGASSWGGLITTFPHGSWRENLDKRWSCRSFSKSMQLILFCKCLSVHKIINDLYPFSGCV